MPKNDSFQRKDPVFSLCGLNCALCSMKLGGHCPGCGFGNRPCKAARCGMAHQVKYCFQCGEYPCAIYEHAADSDSFITHQNQKSDLAKAKQIGIAAYDAEQMEKEKLLHTLLSDYNSGREKTLYCLAVNLLSLDDVRDALDQTAAYSTAAERTLKEKAAYISDLLCRSAQQRHIELKLRKK